MASASTKADRLSATLLLLFGVFVIVEARSLPYWSANAPGPGFVPLWLGVLLACGSLALFARTVLPRPVGSSAPAAAGSTLRVATIVAFTAAAAGLSLVIGLVLASGVFMGATLAFLRPDRRRGNLAAALVTPILVWLLFVRWLGVPLPAGLFG